MSHFKKPERTLYEETINEENTIAKWYSMKTNLIEILIINFKF